VVLVDAEALGVASTEYVQGKTAEQEDKDD